MALASIVSSLCQQLETAIAEDAECQKRLQADKSELHRKKEVCTHNAALRETNVSDRKKEARDSHLKRRAELLAALEEEDKSWEATAATFSSEIEQIRRDHKEALSRIDKELSEKEEEVKARASSQAEMFQQMQATYQKLAARVDNQGLENTTNLLSSISTIIGDSEQLAEEPAPAQTAAPSQPTGGNGNGSRSGSSSPDSGPGQPPQDEASIAHEPRENPNSTPEQPPQDEVSTVPEPSENPAHTIASTQSESTSPPPNSSPAPDLPSVQAPDQSPCPPSVPPAIPDATTSPPNSQINAPNSQNHDSRPRSPGTVPPASPTSPARQNRPDAFTASPQRESRATPSSPAKKTITLDQLEKFDEVMKVRHRIFLRRNQGLKEQLSFSILRCDVHRLAFASINMEGAIKHLSEHGGCPEARREAEAKIFELFGIQVLDCKQSTMEHYNDELDMTDREACQPRATQADNIGVVTPSSPKDSTKKTKSTFLGVTKPAANGLYRARPPGKSSRWEAVLMLPWQAAASTCLFDEEKFPPCLAYDRSTRKLSWRSGFNDGGGLETLRNFPVLYFSGGVCIPETLLETPFALPKTFPGCVSWISAKDLRLSQLGNPAEALDAGRSVAEAFIRWRQKRAFESPAEYLFAVSGQGMQLPLILAGPDPTLQANSLAAVSKGREEDHRASNVVIDLTATSMDPPTWKRPLPSPPIATRVDNEPPSDYRPGQVSPRLPLEPRTPLSPPLPSPWQDESSDSGHSTIVVAPLPTSTWSQNGGNPGSVNGSTASSPTTIYDVYDPENIGDDDVPPSKRGSDHLGKDIVFFSQPPGKRLKTTHGAERAVAYETVYANGQPQHRIVRVPRDQHEGKWYIFFCVKHFRIFRHENVYKQLYNHLAKCNRIVRHKWRESCWDSFVARFGVQVLGCDAQKEAQSNQALDMAVAKGGIGILEPEETLILKYIKTLQGYENRVPDSRVSEWPPDTVPNRGVGYYAPATCTHPPPATAVVQPVARAIRTPQPGDLYRVMSCMIGRERLPCVVLVLPTGDFGQIGLAGRLADTGLLSSLQHIPVCYRLNQSPRSIEGWAPEYQDGGPRVEERWYPVMCFISSVMFAKNVQGDGASVTRVNPYNWVYARDLLPVDLDGENTMGLWGFDAARQFRPRRLQ